LQSKKNGTLEADFYMMLSSRQNSTFTFAVQLLLNRYGQLRTGENSVQEDSADISWANHVPTWLDWLDQCPSTNTWALDHLSQLEHGAVVFTREQTAGRGQRGRTWQSPPGVLTFSVVLASIPVEQLPGLSLVAGLAVIYALEDLIPDLQGKLSIKWPNDLLFEGRKLVGILCESVVHGVSGKGKVVVGIGLNHSVDFTQTDPASNLIETAISLHQMAAPVPDELSLLQQIRHYLLQTAGLLCAHENSAQAGPGLMKLLPALRQRDALLGRSITIELSDESISGEATGFSDEGFLLLRLPDGTQRTFSSGHIAIA
jgi:BirA family transcriptional regulator, biotin operon repressor / biotin---[acetyl-CoA-carboxylase] ligase